MKTLTELMADARDCENEAEEYSEDRTTIEDFKAGHRAAMDRMEPAFKVAISALEFQCSPNTKFALEKIREILAKEEG